MAASGLAGVLALSGCGADFGAIVLGDSSDAVVTSNPPIGMTNADPDAPIVVTARNGRLNHVSVLGPDGKPMNGVLDDTGTTWTSSAKTLAFGAAYRIQASAVDIDGLEASLDNGFSTVKPTDTFVATVANVAEGDVVGVGMPVRLVFSRPVADKREIEDHLDLYSSKPVVGAWSWDADRTAVTFRPQNFWPGHTRIALQARLHGAQAAKGVYGTKNMTMRFSTGASMVSTVDAASYYMTVVRDGKKVRTVPITTGKPGFETRSGTKLVIAKEGTLQMSDPALRGTREFYDLPVEYSMRVTTSGEFVHAAPWSVGSQGRANVSHGCIGMSTSNAAWMYENTLVGDVVIVKNTGRPQDLGNGITDWNIPWKQWLRRSATGAKTVAPGRLVAKTKPVQGGPASNGAAAGR